MRAFLFIAVFVIGAASILGRHQDQHIKQVIQEVRASGATAHAAGLEAASNPYQGDWRGEHWLAGYIEAMQEQYGRQTDGN